MIWYGPSTFKDIKDTNHCYERYGNVVFSMKTLFGYEGIIRENVNIYFIEVIEYKKQAACRFLVTTNIHPGLRKYDPSKKGGPFYYDCRNGQYSYLTHIKSRRYDDRRLLKNCVEFMKEQSHTRLGYNNHFFSFTHCQSPKGEALSLKCCHETNQYPFRYIPNSYYLYFSIQATMEYYGCSR